MTSSSHHESHQVGGLGRGHISTSRAEPDGLAVILGKGFVELAPFIAFHFQRIAWKCIVLAVERWK